MRDLGGWFIAIHTLFRRDGFPTHSVTPDLFRGPPGRKRMVAPQTPLLTAEWTPEQVRGDGSFGAMCRQVGTFSHPHGAVERDMGVRRPLPR
ncbi:hypothetical protein HD841_000608 [Sphingomonas melonis]|uniref:Uncharacterized protein n=1 Tax=Sphingomonas melonis TaxID=152682 RepID=A0A7Y9FK77_9SPHN|nr:hypothetical protein [Sphingomonas melonis]